MSHGAWSAGCIGAAHGRGGAAVLCFGIGGAAAAHKLRRCRSGRQRHRQSDEARKPQGPQRPDFG
jgi:hypothetical protein